MKKASPQQCFVKPEISFKRKALLPKAVKRYRLAMERRKWQYAGSLRQLVKKLSVLKSRAVREIDHQVTVNLPITTRKLWGCVRNRQVENPNVRGEGINIYFLKTYTLLRQLAGYLQETGKLSQLSKPHAAGAEIKYWSTTWFLINDYD